MAHYAAVKERLVAGVPASGTAIVGVDDAWCRAIADRLEQSGKRVVRVSVRHDADRRHLCRRAAHRARAFAATLPPIAELGGIGSLRGVHNAQNAACAAAAALALGLSTAAIQAGLRSFPGLAHRMEEVGRRGGVLFVNDSKATNADSTAQALACFDDIFWIAGGKPKTGGIESLRSFFPRIRKAYLIGEAAEEFAATLGERGAARDRRHARQGGRRRRARRRSVVRDASRSCCCRRPAPRSTSTAISKSAATPSARWSARCPAWPGITRGMQKAGGAATRPAAVGPKELPLLFDRGRS